MTDPFSRESKIKADFFEWVKYGYEGDFLNASQCSEIADWFIAYFLGTKHANK